MCPLEIGCLTGGPFGTNAYALIDADSAACAVVDPGYEADKEWGAFLRERGLRLESILLTHGHIDHTSGVAALAREFPDVPILMNPADNFYLEGGNAMAARMYGLPPFESFAPTGALEEGRPVKVGGLEFEVLHVPGHTPGHVVLRRGNKLIGGDVVFAGSIGRTDLPGGDHELFMRMIAKKILTLPDDVTIYPGHGPTTTIGRERRSNPFLLEIAQSRA